jgi:hypothetical protein
MVAHLNLGPAPRRVFALIANAHPFPDLPAGLDPNVSAAAIYPDALNIGVSGSFPDPITVTPEVPPTIPEPAALNPNIPGAFVDDHAARRGWWFAYLNHGGAPNHTARKSG